MGRGLCADLRQQVTAGDWRWTLGKDLGIRTLGKKASEAAELYEKSQRLEGEGQLLPGGPAPASVGPGSAGGQQEELLLFPRSIESGVASRGLAEDQDLGKIAVALQSAPRAKVP